MREFLIAHVNDPKKWVQRSAIAALGTLGDPQAIPLLKTFALASEASPAQAAAEQAMMLLRSGRKPVDDFKNLRSEVMDLQKTSQKLRKDLDDLKQQVAARKASATTPAKQRKN